MKDAIFFTRICITAIVRWDPSWIANEILFKAQRCLLSIVATGLVPRHIAFSLDENRRYARRKHKEVKWRHDVGLDTFRKVALELFASFFCQVH
jgi:ditrans,polycis-polyprenyl diphosphate synthase